MGGDIRVGTAGGVEQTGVGSLGERSEVSGDDGVLVGRTGEIVGEASAGEESRDGGFRDVVCGTDSGYAEDEDFMR